MQDKDFHNNSEFDGAFVDQSWSNMKALLDKEMPIDAPPPVPQGSKNYLLLLLFLIIGFAAGAGVFVAFSKIKKADPEPPAKRLPIAQSIPIEASKLRSAPPVLHQYNSSDHLVGKKQNQDAKSSLTTSTEQNLSLAYASTPTLNTTSSTNYSTVNANTAVTAKAPPSEVVAQQADIAQADQQDSQMLPAADIDDSLMKSTQQSASTVSASFGSMAMLPKAIPALASQLIQPAMTLVQLPKKKRLRFGATVAGHLDNKLGGAGYSAGPMIEYDLDKKFTLRSGLNYTHIEHSGEGNSFASLDQGSVPDQNGGSIVEQLDNYSTTLVPTMDYLTVPVLLTYDLNSSVKVSAGAEFSYLINADTKIKHDGSANFDPNTVRPIEERFDSDDKSNLRSGNIAAQIGVGYYPMDNLGFDLSYNLGLLDYTKEGAYTRQFDNHKYIKFSLNYYFSRR